MKVVLDVDESVEAELVVPTVFELAELLDDDVLDVDESIEDELVETAVLESVGLDDDEVEVEVELMVKLVEKVLGWEVEEAEVLPPMGPTSLPFELERELDVLEESEADEVEAEVLPPMGPTLLPFELERVLDVLKESEVDEVEAMVLLELVKVEEELDGLMDSEVDDVVMMVLLEVVKVEEVEPPIGPTPLFPSVEDVVPDTELLEAWLTDPEEVDETIEVEEIVV
ncbi:hypothetical protein H2200_011038 [Cladophialophora chaetospira]|uniref:Uncharacterized protein n=1 Tax=Cladophialophora chaetospira TaxID=386627 RepID=A0AA39CDF7_9EURO|nr:hypothetical protein H2200_011038 [Cladophialophora chaetospira]